MNTDKILLIGNPNVGKSVFFSELTGLDAVSSNYVGTTVDWLEGIFNAGGKDYTLIDVPGLYSLADGVFPPNFIENEVRLIICVLDASNLERNLSLALEIKKRKCKTCPIIYALNLSDVAERHSIFINEKLLSVELAAPVIPTVAVKKQGLDVLRKELEEALSREADISKNTCGGNCKKCPFDESGEVWQRAKEIFRRVVKKTQAAVTFTDKLEEYTVRPFPGLPIAFLVTAALIGFIVGTGEFLRGVILEPLVEEIIVPFFALIFSSFIPEGVFLNILIGEYGIFVISFEWILAVIIPYVFLFYVAFSFLEDSGYMPRLSILFDNIMRKIGCQGGSLVQVMMGFGCSIPAIMGTRAFTSEKERKVITAAVCFSIPCISQTGAIITLLSAYSPWLFPAMLGFMIFLFITASFLASKLIKGKTEPLLIELPNLLLPSRVAYLRKLKIRMKHFLKDAEGPMLFAVVIAALLKETGAIDSIANLAQGFVSGWLGLPKDAVIGLILGVVRREMAVAPLLSLELTGLQAFVAGAVSLMYLPCLSVFGVLVSEFKLKFAVLIFVSTTFTALFIGGIINHLSRLFI